MFGMRMRHPPWRQLRDDFAELRQTDFRTARVDHTARPGEDDWRIAGWGDEHSKRRFEALARTAGDKLLDCLPRRSPERAQLSSEPDSQNRWFMAVRTLGRDYRLLSPLPGHDIDEDGNVVGKFFLGGIDRILEASITLCAELEARYPDPMRPSSSSDHPAERVAVFVFGVVFIFALIVAAIVFPEPSAFQYAVFRIVLALAAAGVAAFIPGFIHVEVQSWLRAGGALAVFAIVYFFSPANLVATPSPPPAAEARP